MESSKKHNIDTVVKLFVPESVGIKLVAIQEVRAFEKNALWSSIFLGIGTSILGALISLHASDYNNNPVLAILWLFLILFGVLTSIFTKSTIDVKTNIENTTYKSGTPNNNLISTNSSKSHLSQLQNVKTIIDGIFKDTDSMDNDSFITILSNMRPNVSTEDLEKAILGFEVLEVIIKDGKTTKLNPEFDIVKVAQKVEKNANSA